MAQRHNESKSVLLLRTTACDCGGTRSPNSSIQFSRATDFPVRNEKFSASGYGKKAPILQPGKIVLRYVGRENKRKRSFI